MLGSPCHFFVLPPSPFKKFAMLDSANISEKKMFVAQVFQW